MPAEAFLIRDLAIVMIAAAATSLLFQRLKQPAVLAYLVAGVIVGPHLLPVPLVRDPGNIAILAQLGTLFLLFSVGLNFRLAQLKRVGGIAVTAGVLEIALMIGVGILAATFFGWATLDAIFLGAILSMSGAAIILKILDEIGQASAPTTQIVYGIVIVEKLAAVLILTLLSSLALTGTFQPAELGAVVLRIVLFILVALVIGLLLVPRFIDFLTGVKVQETLVIATLGIAFGFAMVAEALGLSLALGAFIAGALIAESRAGSLVDYRVTPLKDAFIAVFFVSMGLLVTPADILANWVPILALSAVVVAGKIGAVGFSTFVAGYPPRQAFQVGISMAMIGGVALVIANLGQDLGVTDPVLFPIVASVVAITTFVTSVLIRNADGIVNGGARFIPKQIRQFSRMYTGWMNRNWKPGSGGLLPGVPTQSVARVVAYGALFAVLTIALGFSLEFLARARPDATVLTDVLVAGAWVVYALLSIPVLWGLVRGVRTLVDATARSLMPPPVMESRHGPGVAAVLRNTMYVFATVVFATIVFVAGAVFLPPLPLFAGAILVVVVAAYLLRASYRRLNREVEDALDLILTDASVKDRDQVLDVIRERYGGNISLEHVLIPPGSIMVNHSIREMALPHRSGATVVTHERHDRRLVNPPPDLILQPGDDIGILGTPEEVAASKKFILKEAPPTPPPGHTPRMRDVHVEEIPVGARSTVAGRPLAESRIRETTGATVMALKRQDLTMPSPAPATLLQPGDVLVILGSLKQVQAARRLLAPGA